MRLLWRLASAAGRWGQALPPNTAAGGQPGLADEAALGPCFRPSIQALPRALADTIHGVFPGNPGSSPPPSPPLSGPDSPPLAPQ
jgi:hypothetical protein